MAAALLLLLLHVSASIIILASGSKDCHADDKAALLAVKAAFSNPSYLSTAWGPDAGPCCDWYGVECEHSIDIDRSWGRVTSLAFLRDANLTGALPGAAIAGLTHLQALTFFKVPGVSGPIPDSSLLTTLTTLTISRTGVSGAIPSSLGSSLPHLQELDLSFNALTGVIPPSLASPPSLLVINLSRNRLTGTIPPLLFSRFVPSSAGGEPGVYLTLSHNDLSGSIPPEFAAVSFLGFDVSRNRLTGDASPVLSGAGKPLVAVNLARNTLSFNLSAVVELPEKVEYVDVSHNTIYGGVPAQVGSLTGLQQFNVSYNRLCGELPVALRRFNAYSFQHNKCLCGAPLGPCAASHH